MGTILYVFKQKISVVVILVCIFQYARPCNVYLMQFVPRDKQYPRSDYQLQQFESKRSKTLDCTCGTIPPATNDKSEFLYPWEVIITHIAPINSPGPGKICRGTIINDRVILTSAFCTMKVSHAELLDNPWKGYFFSQQCYAQPNELRVWITYGVDTIGKVGLEVTDIYTNPLFLFHRIAYDKVDYDIALLTLKTPLNFEKDQSLVPVCLPHSSKLVKDKDLEGMETQLSRWYMTDIQNFTTMTQVKPTYKSFIFPRMRCRIITETNWISDRFLCTLSPKLSEKQFIDDGAALVVKNGEQYSQVGIHSWRTYFPLLHDRKPVSLASNIFGFLRKIEEYSTKMNAQWCKNKWNGLPMIASNYKSSEINDHVHVERPWKYTSSRFRNVRKSCKCGEVNSRSPEERIQGGEDTVPYEYGWQVQLIFHFGQGKSDHRQICGGAIINSRIVITAGHCVFDSKTDQLADPRRLRVYLHRHKGVSDRDDMSRLAKVEAIIPHPYYTFGRRILENDIALIVLRKPICFKCLQGKVSPLCFPETGEVLDLDGRDDAAIIGWGRTEVFDSTSHAAVLQQTSATIISREECIKKLSGLADSDYFVTQVLEDEKKICASKLTPAWNYSDPTRGDSGGPLFLPVTRSSATNIHVGIASMITMSESAVQFRDPTTITFYTRSQSYLEFVDFYSLVVDAFWCSR